MPAWLDPLLDATEMRETDRWAIDDRGIPSLELMEAAGTALAEAAASLATERGRKGPIGILCGPGNNGGDGLVAARRLDQMGRTVEVALTAPPERLSPDSAANLKRLPDRVSVLPEASVEQIAALAERCDVLVDALLGTGFKGPPREPLAATIRVINAAGLPIVAADIASGIDASNGEVADDPGSDQPVDEADAPPDPLAVRATRTVTFHSAKIGHMVRPGKRFTGRLTVAPIGIPDGGAPGVTPRAGRILPEVLDDLPRRGPDSTKFSSGHVVVVGGSRGLTGAPCMAAQAAIRAGVGYATVAVPADLEPIFEQKLTEVMSVGCPSPGGRFGEASAAAAVEACRRGGVALLGPGLGRAPETMAFAQTLVGRLDGPLVIDADGLAAFNGERLELLGTRGGDTLLTPHEGELGRLLGRPSASVARQRLAAAREAALRARALVVLKGDDTIVTDGERVAINALSAPALATAGTGDVLAGLIAAMLARLGDPFQAAAAAVFAHARAGRLAAENIGLAESVIAGDVIAALPGGLRR